MSSYPSCDVLPSVPLANSAMFDDLRRECNHMVERKSGNQQPYSNLSVQLIVRRVSTVHEIARYHYTNSDTPR